MFRCFIKIVLSAYVYYTFYYIILYVCNNVTELKKNIAIKKRKNIRINHNADKHMYLSQLQICHKETAMIS